MAYRELGRKGASAHFDQIKPWWLGLSRIGQCLVGTARIAARPSESRKPLRQHCGSSHGPPMLTVLNILQLVLYIALLALAGQGILYVLAGARRESNFFYRLLQVVARPFTMVMRKLTPRQVADRHVPVITFFLLLLAYAVVTFEKINLCLASNMVGCR